MCIRDRRGCIDSGLQGYQFCNQAAAGYPIITQTHRRGLICGRRRQNPDRHPSFDRPATAFARRGARCRHTLVRARQVEKTGPVSYTHLYEGAAVYDRKQEAWCAGCNVATVIDMNGPASVTHPFWTITRCV